MKAVCCFDRADVSGDLDGHAVREVCLVAVELVLLQQALQRPCHTKANAKDTQGRSGSGTRKRPPPHEVQYWPDGGQGAMAGHATREGTIRTMACAILCAPLSQNWSTTLHCWLRVTTPMSATMLTWSNSAISAASCTHHAPPPPPQPPQPAQPRVRVRVSVRGMARCGARVVRHATSAARRCGCECECECGC